MRARFVTAIPMCLLLLLAGLFAGSATHPLRAAPLPGTKLTIEIRSAATGKPIDRASVIVRFKEGRSKVNMKKITTSWETKTNQAGSAVIPEIPQGKITVQVIAQNFQTFGDVYELDQPEQTIAINLNAPQPQYSEDAKPK